MAQMMSDEKAMSLVPYVGVTARDARGRIVGAITPAMARSEAGKRLAPRVACVKVERARTKDGVNQSRVTCKQVEGDADEGSPCIAAEEGKSVCYHAKAVLILSAREQGHRVEFTRSASWAQRQAEQKGGTWAEVYIPQQAAPVLYLILTPMDRKPQEAEPVQESKPASKPADPVPVPHCYHCPAPLVSPRERETGLCPACDKSFSNPAPVAPVVPAPGPYDGGPAAVKAKRSRKKS